MDRTVRPGSSRARSSRRSAGPAKPRRVARDLTFHFLHAGRGQSTAIQFPDRSWLVVDANKTPGTKANPLLSLLEAAMKEPDFRLRAIIITHFNSDHYSGVIEVLAKCQEVAEARDVPLGEVVESLVLPFSYDKFYRWLEKREDGVRQPHLSDFLDVLSNLREKGVLPKVLAAPRIAWRETTEGTFRSSECWVFAFQPSEEGAFRDFLKLLGRRGQDLAANPSALEGTIRQNENRYSYVLGVGHGKAPGDLHVLLTADCPGSTLAELTKRLRTRDLLDLGGKWRKGKLIDLAFGANRDLHRLAVRDTRKAMGVRRLLPISGFTVPHHGSGVDRVQASTLEWWLDGHRSADRPPLAIVQGSQEAVREETIDELAPAGCRIFTTSRPNQLCGPGEPSSALGGRLPAAPEAPRCWPYAYVGVCGCLPPKSGNLKSEIVQVALSGGKGGPGELVLLEVYEISPVRREVVYHRRCEVAPWLRPSASRAESS